MKIVFAGLILLLVPSVAAATEIMRWVDADGVVHFGDRHAAPQRGAEVIELRKANGMDVPEAPAARSAQSANVVRLERGKLENKRGWRGYDSRPRRRNIQRNVIVPN